MKHRAFHFVALLLAVTLFTANAFAEFVSYPYSYYGDDWAFPPVFDDRVFDVGPKYPPQTDGTGRYLARAPRYSHEQRLEWIRECESLRDLNFSQFQHCFREHKQRWLHPERNAAPTLTGDGPVPATPSVSKTGRGDRPSYSFEIH